MNKKHLLLGAFSLVILFFVLRWITRKSIIEGHGGGGGGGGGRGFGGGGIGRGGIGRGGIGRGFGRGALRAPVYTGGYYIDNIYFNPYEYYRYWF
jgi:hypothetical protein